MKNNDFRNQKDFKTAREQISKINIENIIKEALESGKDNNSNKQIFYIKDDLLEEMRSKILKSYLESVKDKTIKEIKSELNIKIDEYIKNIKILLIRANYDIDEYKKKYEKIEIECNNIKEKYNSLIRYNQDLIKEINNYQSNLNSLHQSYELLLKQKDLFEVILREYSSNTPDEILLELKLAKEGSLLLLENYNQIIKENNLMKEEIKKMKKKYDFKYESIINEFENYKEDKNNEEKENNFKIRYLENKLYNNNKYQKENNNLHHILYHLYNLLFEEFNLNKGIANINKKYLNLKKSDFEPNVMYDNEIKNYIELMIKSMHRNSQDIIFRECVGYLNMIIRKYFPNKRNLRFKPVEMLIEIKKFIDNNIKIINDGKKIIEQYKDNYFKLQKENSKINKKLYETNENYNSYQLLMENQMAIDNRHLMQLKKNLNNRNNNKINNNSNNTNNNINNNNNNGYNNTYNNNTINRNITFNNFKDNINNINNKSLYTIRKNKFKKENNIENENENKLIKNREIFKSNEEKNKYLLLTNKDENKNKKNNNILKMRQKSRNKSCRIFKSKTLTKDINCDKIKKVNGNNKEFKFYHDFNFLIEETNRLFLYQPRMNSYNEKISLNDNSQKKNNGINILNIKNKKINDFNNNKVLENHVNSEINNLIKAFNK